MPDPVTLPIPTLQPVKVPDPSSKPVVKMRRTKSTFMPEAILVSGTAFPQSACILKRARLQCPSPGCCANIAAADSPMLADQSQTQLSITAWPPWIGLHI